MTFKKTYESFLETFGQGKTMVLSTSFQDKVTSRMMSIVLINGKFYFQTDQNFRKYKQLCSNPNVALCSDNIQIEGRCKEIGHPTIHTEFCKAYQSCFKGSYEAYTALEDERLFEIEPIYIQRWLYIEGKPFIEVFQVENQEYTLNEYKIFERDGGRK